MINGLAIYNKKAAAMGGYLAMHTNPPGGLAHYYARMSSAVPARLWCRSMISAHLATRCCASWSTRSRAHVRSRRGANNFWLSKAAISVKIYLMRFAQSSHALLQARALHESRQ